MVFCLEGLDILLWNLHIWLQLQNINQKLTFVGQLLLVILDDILIARWGKIVVDVEEHSVFIGLLHNVCYLYVQVVDKITSWVINDFLEALKTNSTFTNVSVEKTDSNNDIGQLAKLGNFFWSC